jgi:serine/threonine-protein kinase RsbW
VSDEQSVGKIQLASDLSLLHRVESLVGEATAGTGLDHASTADIVTAVSEIVINAMVHGNRLDHDLHVDIETFADTDQVKVVVQDEGEGFDPGAVSDPTQPDRLLLPNGRGLFISKMLCDGLVFSRQESGMRVELTKRTKP